MMEKAKENQKVYKWNRGRLVVFSIALLNAVLGVYVSFNLVYDNYFLNNQLGLSLNIDFGIKVIIAVVSLALLIFLNYKLIIKNVVARNIISAIQTVGYAFIIRNLVIAFMFNGFRIQHYYMQIVCFVIMSVLIYMTMFSQEGLIYFGLEGEERA